MALLHWEPASLLLRPVPWLVLWMGVSWRRRQWARHWQGFSLGLRAAGLSMRFWLDLQWEVGLRWVVWQGRGEERSWRAEQLQWILEQERKQPF